MEIARSRFEGPKQCAMVHQAPCNEVHDVAVALDRAVDPEQAGAQQLASLLLDQAAPDDDIHVPGLILQGHEHHAARRVRPLAAGDEARDARRAAVRQIVQLSRIAKPHRLQLSAKQGERMAPERKAEARVVGDDVGTFGRRCEHRQ